MPKSPDPGPPLRPEPEFCENDPPDGMAYAKAIGAALLLLLAGSIAWFSVAVYTQRLWSVTTVVVGAAAGWLIHRSADRHRSLFLGIMAGGTTVLAAAAGYIMLWLPLADTTRINKHVFWYDLAIAGVGAYLAYRLAGPKPLPDHLD